MESMLTFLSSCLKSVDLDIVTKADMRKMYMEEKGLSQLSSADKKLFSVAVTTALEKFRCTGNKISVVNPDSKKEGTNTAVEDSCGETNENQAEMKSAESDSDDDFSPENEKNDSYADKKKSGRKILSDSEMSAEETENVNLDAVSNKGIIVEINENQNDHVLDDEQDSNESSVFIVRSEDGENHKDAISDLSNKKISDDESSQEVPVSGKDLANGHKKRLMISSSSENDSNSSQDDSSAKTTTPKRKRIKLSNSNSAKSSQDKKSNSAQKKSGSSKRQVVSSSDSEEDVTTNSLQKGEKFIPSPDSTKRLTKKNVSESDDDSMESPTKQTSSEVSSDSENDSLALLSEVKSGKSLDNVNGSTEKEMDSLSDDEPLVNISKQNLNKTEDNPTRKKRIVESEQDSSNKADSSNDSEEEPIVELAKKSNKKVKNTKYNSIKKSLKVDSSESEDEPLSNFSKQTSNLTVTDKISSNESEEDIPKSKPQKIDSASDSEDEPLVKLAKKSSKKARVGKDKSVRKSLNAVSGSSNEDSCESEDEPLEQFSKRKLSESKCKPVASKKNSIASKEDTPKSKPQKIDSASDSEDEPLMKLPQKNTKNVKPVNNKSVKKSTKSKKIDSSDSDEEPLEKKISTSVEKSSPSKDSSSSSIDENEEQSPKKDMQSKKEKVSISAKEKKRPSASENKIEHLKKYVRAAGIRVQNYTKLFSDCKSMKAKSEKLMDLLEKHGLKGNPTLEKCKKLKKKIETKKEIAELDLSNILKTEGRRPKRSVCADTTNYNEPVEKASTPVKRFSRLQEIFDSEGSD